MAETFSVKAMLSAVDNGFSSTLKSALGNARSFGSELKSGLGFGVLAGVGQQAFTKISSGISGLVGEIDSANASWKTFESNMSMLNWKDGDIKAAKKTLQDFAQKTVYSSSDMATTFAQLAAVGVKDTDQLVMAFGGLAAAAENPQQAMKTLSQQATQMAAKPSVAWQDFKLMLEQTPAGIAAVAREMGMTTSELVTAVQNGEVSTTKFFNAIKKAGGAGTDLAKLATEAKTVGQAMDGLKETVANKLTPAWEVLTKKGIGAVNGLADKLGKIDATAIATKVSKAADVIGKYWGALKSAFSGTGKAIMDAIKAIVDSFTELTGAFGSKKSVGSFKSMMQSVAGFIKGVAGIIQKHAGLIAKFIQLLPKIWLAMQGYKIAKVAAPFVTTFGKGIASLAQKGLNSIPGKLEKVSKAQDTVGKTSQTSGVQMLNSAKSFALMGAAVLLIAAGFALLAFSAIKLAAAGPLAIGVMAGLVIALAGLGFGMGMLLKTLAPMGAQMMPVATAFVALGAAALLIAAGFALLAFSAISLANSGGLAIGVMVGMVAAIALLAVGAALLGPALTAGAVGFIAFGAAILLVGAGVLLASAGLALLATQLPTIATFGLSAAMAIVALGTGLMVFAAGCLLAGAGALVLGVGLTVAAVGITLVGVAAVVAAVGIAALAAGILLLGASLMLTVLSVTMLGATLPIMAAGATACVGAFGALLGVSVALAATMLLLSVPLLLLAPSAAAAAIGIAAFGIAMAGAAIGTIAMAAALKGVSSQMKTISKNAKSAEKSLKSMKKSISVVEEGLDAIGSKAKSAMKALTSAFDNTASKAKSAGQKVGSGFTTGLQAGLAKATIVAMQASMAVSSALNGGYSSAYSSGAYISKGFANGMLSQLGVIQNAAAKMAAAAEKAVRAKAKIKSPSRVTTELGNYWGEGFANGIVDMAKDAWRAAESLVEIPNLAMPSLAGAYSGEMSVDYNYSRNSSYTIEVPLAVDGKEFARATARYTQNELERNQKRENRKYGKV